MRYQLVIQFAANNTNDFDQLVALEQRLIEDLESIGTVDGHDFGRSEFNIFILTDEPAMIFDKASRIVRDQKLQQGMRVAYRESSGESYVILWPPTLAEFIVS
jgi:hypothetical protein